MALSKPIQIAAIGVLIASLAALLLSLVQLPPYIDPAVHKDIGRAIARETLTLRKPGAPIIVIKRDTAAFPQPAADYQFKAFKKELARAKVEIASVQEVRLDPLKPVEVPPGDFLNLIRKAPADSVDAAAATRGQTVFKESGRCASCHSGTLYTDVNEGRLHAPSETGMDARYALRTTQKAYRTTPLRGLLQHAPYFHDGSAATLAAVVDHYDGVLSLRLSAQQKADLIQYLRSL